MKCESKISAYCKKNFKKSEVKYIWNKGKALEVCGNCYWLIQQQTKAKIALKQAETPHQSKKTKKRGKAT